MLTAGVDLSRIGSDTWLAVLDWDGVTGSLDRLENVGNYSEIVDIAKSPVAKMGINCPLGWPMGLTDYMRDPIAIGANPLQSYPMDQWLTDARVNELLPDLQPRNVMRDGLGRAAINCVRPQTELSQAGVHVEPAGFEGLIAEMHSSASLYQWHMPFKGYKGSANATALHQTVSALGTSLTPTTEWLNFGRWRDTCTSKHRAFDALVSALTA